MMRTKDASGNLLNKKGGKMNDVVQMARERVSSGIKTDLYRTKYLRAFKNRKAKQPAIAAMCCMCLGFEDCMSGIRDCKSYGCPLWEHRPYKHGVPDDE